MDHTVKLWYIGKGSGVDRLVEQSKADLRVNSLSHYFLSIYSGILVELDAVNYWKLHLKKINISCIEYANV